MSLNMDEIRGCWESRGGWVDFTRDELDALERAVAAESAFEELAEHLRACSEQCRAAESALAEIAALRCRMHPIAGYMYDEKPHEIARAALARSREQDA